MQSPANAGLVDPAAAGRALGRLMSVATPVATVSSISSATFPVAASMAIPVAVVTVIADMVVAGPPPQMLILPYPYAGT